MADTFSYTGTRVATDVRDTFGDPSAVQLTDVMLLRWTNDAQRQIAQDADLSVSQATAPLIQGLGTLDVSDLLAGQRLKQIQAITIAGQRLKLVSFHEYLDMLDDVSVKATGTPTVGMLRGNALTLYPVPATTVANALTLFFTQWPLDLSALTDPLSVPDRYYDPLRDYVLSRAREMNDDLEGAQSARSQFVAGVQGQYEKENASPTEAYPIVPGQEWV